MYLSQRVILLEAWKEFEKEHGNEETQKVVEDKLPKVVRKRRKAPDSTEDNIIWEEYFDYIFPDDEVQSRNLKFLAMAHAWAKKDQSNQIHIAFVYCFITCHFCFILSLIKMNDHHCYKLPLWKDTYLESWTMRNLNVFISLDSMHLGLVCMLKRVLSESVILYIPLRTTWISFSHLQFVVCQESSSLYHAG